jgi:LisH
MDYLVIEGYKSAAEEFGQEANLAAPVDFESIESRMVIREALQRGDVEDAITRVNDLNPEVRWSYIMWIHRIMPFHAPFSVLGAMMRPNTKTSVFNMIQSPSRLLESFANCHILVDLGHQSRSLLPAATAKVD